MLKLSAPVKWGGFVLIVLVGLIHAVDAPEYFAKATYVGVLFVLNVLVQRSGSVYRDMVDSRA